MDRGKAVGSVLGIALGIVTMPILGPFCAFSAMLGAWAGKKVYDKCSERSERPANIDTTNRILRNDGDYQLLDYLNRNISKPRLRNQDTLLNSQSTLIPPNHLPNINVSYTQTKQRIANAPYSPDRLIPRTEKCAQRKKRIYVDEFGQVFDPRDEG